VQAVELRRRTLEQVYLELTRGAEAEGGAGCAGGAEGARML